jgi:GxxExxY protein
MPITCPVTLRPVDQEEFLQSDYRVMRCAFQSQNQLGRLADEVIYQNDLAGRLQTSGLGLVRREVPVTVSYRDFAKTYKLDLVVSDAAIYELKTESRLASPHDAQLLHYLFLCGVQHGRFVNTTLTPEARREFKLEGQRWREVDEASRILRTTLLEVLADWGGFLEMSLYSEVLVHVLGGAEKVVQKVRLQRHGVSLVQRGGGTKDLP